MQKLTGLLMLVGKARFSAKVCVCACGHVCGVCVCGHVDLPNEVDDLGM
jgi:hypothetical protein